MNESYFVALNEDGLYLRHGAGQDIDSRPKFRTSGVIVRFSDLFAAVGFFEDSRFDTSKVTIIKVQTIAADSWSFSAALETKQH
ncbi:hypothetical protein EVB81_114 [Rhizobium phage RHph_I46]|uniref:Uncharacterized protein n=1 Tax=Rhizobium phage RHph_I1_9 TaxID=2509729 RepID=A0A7S5R9F8_9CAUD|nr:hypothetical protein PP936_gp113 [Rhizobium phage RHph_I1_9]QIG69683.1 hypothetical protein EVB81_114 [Rhizobium phage RHph_I46]QIG70964.1 hypothetical protein EVB92_114 [Rhizobium phage RHph_I9]QIG73550.1 hypothetical protein EVC04_113 [Rhizobium phage RHph_I1_9]QIG76303.1 hypothetical protein EVC25_114 [Rhizobium phage RHph_I34]